MLRNQPNEKVNKMSYIKYHTESKIDACGRIYYIRVCDREITPFEVLVDIGCHLKILAKFDKRTDAIELVHKRAIMWLKGEHHSVDDAL